MTALRGGEGWGAGSRDKGVVTQRASRPQPKDAQSKPPCDEIAYKPSGTTKTSREKTIRFVAADWLTGAMQGAELCQDAIARNACDRT